MALVTITYIGPANPSDRTGAIRLREGNLIIGEMQYAEVTEEELAGINSSGRYKIYVGIYPGATSATSVTGPGSSTGRPIAFAGADGTIGGPEGSPLSSSIVLGSDIQWATSPELLISGAITRDSNDAAIEAPVVWPDGDTGMYKATSVSSSFPGAVDAYTITKVKGGITRTYTQAIVTRDSTGAVTNRPAITVS